MIERTVAPLHWFRRLRIRREIRDDIHDACPELLSGGRRPCGTGG